jgi:methylglutaconyl-CoA hydratase
MGADVRWSIDERGVAEVMLARADRRNAFDGEVVRALHDAIGQLRRAPHVRVLVIASEGATFCAGADLAHMAQVAAGPVEGNFADASALAAMLEALDACPRPTVARVQGDAFGGGVGLLACCDVAVASSAARFALSEVRLGLVPATISPYVLAAIGPRAMRRYALTGERFDAAQARTIGLVHEVVEPAALDAAVASIVQALLAGGPEAQREVKGLLRELRGLGRDGLPGRATSHRLARLRQSAEGSEGIRAFLERRRPEWHRGES